MQVSIVIIIPVIVTICFSQVSTGSNREVSDLLNDIRDLHNDLKVQVQDHTAIQYSTL